MNRSEINRLYRDYLNDIGDMRKTRYSTAYTHTKGVLHGLGITLGYDYETVERDIAHVVGRTYGQADAETMPGQIRLAI